MVREHVYGTVVPGLEAKLSLAPLSLLSFCPTNSKWVPGLQPGVNYGGEETSQAQDVASLTGCSPTLVSRIGLSSNRSQVA